MFQFHEFSRQVTWKLCNPLIHCTQKAIFTSWNYLKLRFFSSFYAENCFVYVLRNKLTQRIPQPTLLDNYLMDFWKKKTLHTHHSFLTHSLLQKKTIRFLQMSSHSTKHLGERMFVLRQIHRFFFPFKEVYSTVNILGIFQVIEIHILKFKTTLMAFSMKAVSCNFLSWYFSIGSSTINKYLIVALYV